MTVSSQALQLDCQVNETPPPSFQNKHHLQSYRPAAMLQECSEIKGLERNFLFQPCLKNNLLLKLMHSEVAYFNEIGFSDRNMFCHKLFNQFYS